MRNREDWEQCSNSEMGKQGKQGKRNKLNVLRSIFSSKNYYFFIYPPPAPAQESSRKLIGRRSHYFALLSGRLYFVGFATGSAFWAISATLIWLQVLIQDVTVRVSGLRESQVCEFKG